MQSILARKLFTDGLELDNQLIRVENGVIIGVDDAKNVPADVPQFDCVSAGFIDIHINGGDELHFTEDPSLASISNMLQSSRDSGTPYILPTCVTSSWENIEKAIAVVGQFMHQFPDSGVLGLHLEGPFISPAKRGAHLEAFILKPEEGLLESLKKEGGRALKMLTLAPEYFTKEALTSLMEAGIIVSAGHSNATYAEARSSFDAGINVCTHLYNAMSAFGHRAPGLVGAVFDTESVYAPIILDGIHCDFAAARIAYQQKKEKLILISDALFLGRKKKRFVWGEFDATLIDDRYVNSEGNLAGGAISLAEAVVNAVNEVGIPLAEAVEMVTSRPAILLKSADKLGSVRPGYPAVFTVFRNDLTSFQTVTV